MRIIGKKKMILTILMLAALCACSGKEEGTYHQITKQEAIEMMKKDDGHVIVDVRTIEEYEEGHIPGAVCIPNEVIAEEAEKMLPDKEQVILVYCRSGRRSKEASQKLDDLGYRNVYEFGGINDWTGEIEMGNKERIDGVSLIVEIGGIQKSADLMNNASAEALVKKLKEGSLQLDMSDGAGFEKAGQLPFELPQNDEEITTVPGDLVLYQGDQLTICYGGNTRALTKVANIPGVTEEEMKEFLGEGDVKVLLFLDEWEY